MEEKKRSGYRGHPLARRDTVIVSNSVVEDLVARAVSRVTGVDHVLGATRFSRRASLAEDAGRAQRARHGVRAEIDGNSVEIDISIVVKLGVALERVADDVRVAAREQVERVTALHIQKMRVRVVGRASTGIGEA